MPAGRASQATSAPGGPLDPSGKRRGRGGYMTPDAKSNTRLEGETVLRRDCSAPARIRMAVALEKEGVQKRSDLASLLPATWQRLTSQFGRTEEN